MKTWIIQSGSGFFLGWSGQTPKMTSDPVEATRMTSCRALAELAALVLAGFAARPVKVKFVERTVKS